MGSRFTNYFWVESTFSLVLNTTLWVGPYYLSHITEEETPVWKRFGFHWVAELVSIRTWVWARVSDPHLYPVIVTGENRGLRCRLWIPRVCDLVGMTPQCLRNRDNTVTNSEWIRRGDGLKVARPWEVRTAFQKRWA